MGRFLIFVLGWLDMIESIEEKKTKTKTKTSTKTNEKVLLVFMSTLALVLAAVHAYAGLTRGVSADMAPIVSDTIPVVVEHEESDDIDRGASGDIQPAVHVTAASGNTPTTSGLAIVNAPASASPQAPLASNSSASVIPAQASGPRFICRGTRPFWILSVEQNKMSFEISGRGTSINYSGPFATPSENSANAVTNFAGAGTDGSVLTALIVDARHNGGFACNDGSSEQTYEYSVFICRGTEVYDGCCWLER